MRGFQINIDKAKAVILYIAEKLGGTDFHKVFKILYFAEKEHIATFGRPIVGDTYIAMKNGPVPSFIYDALKFAKGDGFGTPSFEKIANSIEVTGQYSFIVKEKADLDELSSSDLDCLNKSIEENRNLTFEELTIKSHDSAWDAADRDDTMDINTIAKAGGANDEMLKYIEECKECHNIAFV